jgi:hypothetical protein
MESHVLLPSSRDIRPDMQERRQKHRTPFCTLSLIHNYTSRPAWISSRGNCKGILIYNYVLLHNFQLHIHSHCEVDHRATKQGEFTAAIVTEVLINVLSLLYRRDQVPGISQVFEWIFWEINKRHVIPPRQSANGRGCDRTS